MEKIEIEKLREIIHHQNATMQKLYAELEEEREASAIAASEALSMILRLEREKAFEHMEACQYRRMAEEKMHHDEEQLVIFENLLYQKEMEIVSLRSFRQGDQSTKNSATTSSTHPSSEEDAEEFFVDFLTQENLANNTSDTYENTNEGTNSDEVDVTRHGSSKSICSPSRCPIDWFQRQLLIMEEDMKAIRHEYSFREKEYSNKLKDMNEELERLRCSIQGEQYKKASSRRSTFMFDILTEEMLFFSI